MARRVLRESLSWDDEDAMTTDDSIASINPRSATDNTLLGHDNVDDDNDSDAEESNDTYMSFMWAGGKLGAAFYKVDTTELYVIPDAAEKSNFVVLQKLLRHINPSVVIISTKHSDRFIKCIQDTVEELGHNPTLVTQVLPSIDFSEDLCRRRILLARLPGVTDDMTEEERTLHLSSIIPFENSNMVRASGALLKYLERNRVGVQLEDIQTRVPVLSFKIFILALQIFKNDFHPSAYKSTVKREGFSLYEMLNKCQSKLGSSQLRKLQWIEIPFEFFASPRNDEVTGTIRNFLKNMRPIRRIFGRMMTYTANIADWPILYKTLYNAVQISEICTHYAPSATIFRKISCLVDEQFNYIVQSIFRVVDFEESKICNRFTVKPNVDAELDDKKRILSGLPDYLQRFAQEELNREGHGFAECHCLYMPQIGYLLSFPLSDEMRATKNYSAPALDFIFVHGDSVYYKSDEMRELDANLGDMSCDIMDIETAIMHRLQNSILESSGRVLDAIQLISELDCLISLANCARMNNYCRPVITRENVIEIAEGRHPLQELCSSVFVPNGTNSRSVDGDTSGGTGRGEKMKVLTGTNASGKSVYLKQVALIVFMAHIGSFVPAAKAQIGLVDRIFTRIQNKESVNLAQSSFMIELNQVACAVTYATSRSLIILDEFGKGTEPVDGLSILCSCLLHWLNLGVDCPHVLVSTHLHGITRPDIMPPHPQLRLQTMEVMEEEGEMVYLYHLIDGSTTISQAARTAARAGVPTDILTRSAEIHELMRAGLPVRPLERLSARAEAERCTAISTRFISLDLDNDDIEAFLRQFVKSTSNSI